jgi:hypothetical protein
MKTYKNINKSNKKIDKKIKHFKHQIYSLAGSHNLLLNLLIKIQKEILNLNTDKNFFIKMKGGTTTNTTQLEKQNLASFNQTQNELLDTIGTTGLSSLKLVMGLADGLIKNTLNTTLNTLDPKLATLSWEDAAPYLKGKVKLLDALVRQFFDAYMNPAPPNPNEFRESVNNILQILSEAAVEILNIVEPKINVVVEKLKSMILKTSTTLGTASVTAGINFVKSGVAAIPVVGGLVNLMLSFGKIFNAMTKIFLIFVDTNSTSGIKIAESVKQVGDRINATQAQLNQQYSNLQNLSKTLPQMPTSTAPKFGGKNKTKKLEKKIKNKLSNCKQCEKKNNLLKNHLNN